MLRRYFYKFFRETPEIEQTEITQKSNRGDIFERYSNNPIFTSNSWGGFQSSLEYWRDLGIKTILLSDEIYASEYLNLFDQFLNSVIDLEPHEFKSSTFFVRFIHDEDALNEIAYIVKQGGKFVSSIESEKTPYRFTNRNCYMALKRTWERKETISHLFPIVHENLCEALEITKGVRGNVLEIGVYKGGSALTILNYLDIQQKENMSVNQRSYVGLDTFTGFDYAAAERSPDLIWYKTHELFGQNETLNAVQNLLDSCSTPSKLYSLDICTDDLPKEIEVLSVVNIDVDMYEPTKIALQKVSPLIQLGGIIICEDVASTPALYGASLAVKEFVGSKEGQKYVSIHKLGQVFLYKTKS